MPVSVDETKNRVIIQEVGNKIVLGDGNHNSINPDGTKVRIEQPLIRIIRSTNETTANIIRDSVRIIQIAAQGPIGPQGLPGSGEGTNNIIATTGSGGIEAYQVVYIDSSNTVKAANALNPTHIGRVIGLTTEASDAGDDVNVCVIGEVINPDWNLTPGVSYFLSDGGNISTSIPVSGFYQRIGRALNTTTLILDLGEPVLMN